MDRPTGICALARISFWLATDHVQTYLFDLCHIKSEIVRRSFTSLLRAGHVGMRDAVDHGLSVLD